MTSDELNRTLFVESVKAHAGGTLQLLIYHSANNTFEVLATGPDSRAVFRGLAEWLQEEELLPAGDLTVPMTVEEAEAAGLEIVDSEEQGFPSWLAEINDPYVAGAASFLLDHDAFTPTEDWGGREALSAEQQENLIAAWDASMWSSTLCLVHRAGA